MAQVRKVDVDSGLVLVYFMERKGSLVFWGKNEEVGYWEPISSVGREVLLNRDAKSSSRSRHMFTYNEKY